MVRAVPIRRVQRGMVVAVIVEHEFSPAPVGNVVREHVDKANDIGPGRIRVIARVRTGNGEQRQ